MVKKKKISRFRELYNVIESLLDLYTFEDVTKLLKDDYDLSLSTGTLKNYVYQHRQYLSNLAVESEQDKSNDHSSIEVDKSSVSPKDDSLLEKPETKNKDFVSAPLSKENDIHVPPTLEELDAAMDDMKKRQELKKLGLL